MKLKNKLLRYRIMDKHRELVKGDYTDMQAARKILHILNGKKYTLYLCDIDYKVERVLEECGVKIRYSHNGLCSYPSICSFND